MKATGKLDESNNLFTIKIPANFADELPAIFQALDDKSKWASLNIKSYNVRVTSLEEVFNMIGEAEALSETDSNKNGSQNLSNNSG